MNLPTQISRVFEVTIQAKAPLLYLVAWPRVIVSPARSQDALSRNKDLAKGHTGKHFARTKDLVSAGALDGRWRSHPPRTGAALMRCCLIVTLSSSLVNASTGAVAHPVRQGDASAVGRAWEFMETEMSRGVPELLHRHQPPPILPELRTRVMAALPSEGELTPTPVERVKLAAVDPVVKIYRRLGSVSLKVVDVPYALVALHGRTVLLVTREALSLITVGEFQAIIAHELAHELFWDDYNAALERDQYERLQELELRCDGVAVMIDGRSVSILRAPHPCRRQADALQRTQRRRLGHGTSGAIGCAPDIHPQRRQPTSEPAIVTISGRSE